MGVIEGDTRSLDYGSGSCGSPLVFTYAVLKHKQALPRAWLLLTYIN